ncbi:cell division protein ZapA [Bacteriovorax sp. Seq25_V]|uniref:cell division protein ZapA n=1 Tax=Bacteriovorax sp. Seq25_V TaxID=1201288 RepID=UPI00038A0549|nr:cell division protein ZapA [Bacteriovorax sp. Seq25_V]EQC46950.1 cell division protein ZapA [Bacteriovorax sp. Seq25_V]
MEVKEFNILGHSIRLKEVEDETAVSPDEIVSYVNNEAIKMKQGNPNLKDSQIAVLLALKYATDKVTLEREYKESITEFEKMAEDAFRLIEEVTPSTH